MKESRLFRILYYILEHKKVTARELADKFEVSIRTIYRDIDWISSAGIPIYAIRGKGGGIEVEDSFTLSSSMFTPDEKEQMIIALKTLENMQGLYKNELASKLSALFQIKNKNLQNWIEVDFSNWQYSNLYQNVFDDLKRAILNKNMCYVKYFGVSGKNTTRTIKPIRLLFKGMNWYIYAFCNLRDDFRFFKLSRIKELEVLNEVYEDDFSDVVINKKLVYDKTVNVKLKFDNSVAYRVYDEFYSNIKEDENYIYTSINLPNNYILYSYIFSFGSGVEVIEPLEVREKVKDIIRKMSKIYNI